MCSVRKDSTPSTVLITVRVVIMELTDIYLLMFVYLILYYLWISMKQLCLLWRLWTPLHICNFSKLEKWQLCPVTIWINDMTISYELNVNLLLFVHHCTLYSRLSWLPISFWAHIKYSQKSKCVCICQTCTTACSSLLRMDPKDRTTYLDLAGFPLSGRQY